MLGSYILRSDGAHPRTGDVFSSICSARQVYNIVEIPFTVCFNVEPALWSPLDVLDFCFDLFFCCDVIVNFRTG